MLENVITFPFIMFIILLFAFFAVTGMAMFNQWAMVQNQAQFVAVSVAKWGIYTNEAEASINNFANQLNLPRSAIKVNTTSGSYGQGIIADVTVPFNFKVGKYSAGLFDIKGMGRAVSTYMPGAYGP